VSVPLLYIAIVWCVCVCVFDLVNHTLWRKMFPQILQYVKSLQGHFLVPNEETAYITLSDVFENVM